MTAKLPLKHCDSSHQNISDGLPIIGPVIARYVEWLRQRGYQPATVVQHVRQLRQLAGWLQRKRYHRLEGLDLAGLMVAYDYFNLHKRYVAGAVRSLTRFLREEKTFPERNGPVPPLEAEQTQYGEYLFEMRGLSPGTISSHLRRLRLFFQFLRLDRRPFNFHDLQMNRIEAYLRMAARSNNRVSMHCIVCCLRGFLKFKHSTGQLRRPLHRQIATPCVYQMEKLPRAIPWPKLQRLLCSIDRSNPAGLRDFTMIYLAATYGLRRSEVARLTLDDIDWRARTLRILQTKTGQILKQPLTDEAANILIRYLQESRPQSKYRHLFLKLVAPVLKALARSNLLRGDTL